MINGNLVSNVFLAVFLGEFFGTAMLLLLGNGVGASVTLKRMFAKNTRGNWLLISFGWGFGVLFGVIICRVFWSGAYLNPAVAIFDMLNGLSSPDILNVGNSAAQIATLQGQIVGVFFVALIAEFLGAFFGQGVLDIISWKHISDPENDPKATRGFHCTAPAYREKAFFSNFSFEFVGTLVLVGVIAAFGSALNSDLANLSVVPVTFLVISIGMSLGSSTGYAINPARDLSPRILYRLLPLKGKASADFKYSIIPVLAPSLAGLLVGIFAVAANLTA